MMRSLVKALFALVAFATPQLAQACVSAIVTDTGAVPYDATAPSDTLRTFQVRITGTCGQTAAFPVRIAFEDDVDLPPFEQVGGVPFAILRAGRNLLQSAASGVVAPFDVAIDPAGEVLEFQLQLAKGYVAETAIRPIELSVSYETGEGFVEEARFPMSVAIAAMPSFSLDLDGGFGTRQMDFGVLQPGESEDTVLGITATGPYRIDMSTEYGEKMRRADPCGIPLPAPRDAADFVPYSVTLGNAVLGEALGLDDPGPSIGSVLAKRAVPVRVTIDPGLQPQQVRAGRYCDVITLSIAPQP
ncbi:MAG: hypothetical protein GC147_12830 [Porphyrobacter sp.]|nr:hypothetical protein [Porphyrobacter sp.]